MTIDANVYNSPASKGDISGTTIATSVVLFEIASALEAVRNGGKPTTEQIAAIRKAAEKLSKLFDGLTGYRE